MFKLLHIIVCLITLPAIMLAEFQLLDHGITVISGPAANTMITYSDVHQKLNLDGRLIPLDHQIKVEIVRQEVIADKMSIDDTYVEKYIANIQKMHNMSIQDLENLAGQCYRTFVELKQQLSLNYTYDFFLHNKFRAHLVPTDQDIQEYCDKNPQIEPGYFVVKMAVLPFGADKDAVIKKGKMIVAGDVDLPGDAWGTPVTVQIDELADELSFIKNLEVDEIFVLENGYGIKLYQLLAKESELIVPLDKRKAAIIDTLNRTMYEDLLEKYEQHMLDNVAIINLVG